MLCSVEVMPHCLANMAESSFCVFHESASCLADTFKGQVNHV